MDFGGGGEHCPGDNSWDVRRLFYKYSGIVREETGQSCRQDIFPEAYT